MTSVAFIGEWGTIPWLTPGAPNSILTADAAVGMMLHELYHSLSGSFDHFPDGIMSVDWQKWPNVAIDPITLGRLKVSPYRADI